MEDRVEDLIDDYIDHYGCSAEEAVTIMKADLDAALAERQRPEAQGEQP